MLKQERHAPALSKKAHLPTADFTSRKKKKSAVLISLESSL